VVPIFTPHGTTPAPKSSRALTPLQPLLRAALIALVAPLFRLPRRELKSTPEYRNFAKELSFMVDTNLKREVDRAHHSSTSKMQEEQAKVRPPCLDFDSAALPSPPLLAP
jgi:hypothetical protein